MELSKNTKICFNGNSRELSYRKPILDILPLCMVLNTHPCAGEWRHGCVCPTRNMLASACLRHGCLKWFLKGIEFLPYVKDRVRAGENACCVAGGVQTRRRYVYGCPFLLTSLYLSCVGPRGLGFTYACHQLVGSRVGLERQSHWSGRSMHLD